MKFPSIKLTTFWATPEKEVWKYRIEAVGRPPFCWGVRLALPATCPLKGGAGRAIRALSSQQNQPPAGKIQNLFTKILSSYQISIPQLCPKYLRLENCSELSSFIKIFSFLRYVIFYLPFDFGYKVMKFMPIKMFCEALKEIYRLDKNLFFLTPREKSTKMLN